MAFTEKARKETVSLLHGRQSEGRRMYGREILFLSDNQYAGDDGYRGWYDYQIQVAK